MTNRFCLAAALRRTILHGVLALVGTASTLQAQGPSLTDTPAGRRAAALLEEIREVRKERVRVFVVEQMSDGLQRMPIEQHLDRFRRLSADIGGSPVGPVRFMGPTAVEVGVRGARGPARLVVEVEPTPPHRITGLRLEAGEGDLGAMPTTPLTDAGLATVVDSAANLLERLYVSRDTGAMIAARLRERLHSGAYARLTDRMALASAMTADIRAVHPDRHLSVAALPAGRGPRRLAPQPTVPDGGFRYIAEARVLPGNVGYLRMSAFSGEPDAITEMAAALRTLERTDAMVIDVRGAPGGDARLTNYLISNFTAPDLVSLAVFDPATGDTVLRRTLARVAGQRRLTVPLFVLIDGRSASAAEDVPFVLRGLGRATLVGETTAGAARNNRIIGLEEAMSMSISVTHVWDPCTGATWERTGIRPDIAVPSADALDAALRAARDPARRPGPLANARCRRG